MNQTTKHPLIGTLIRDGMTVFYAFIQGKYTEGTEQELEKALKPKKKHSGFTRGSGRYLCGHCGRSTRDDGNGDSVNVGLCSQCYEVAGIENQISDGNYKDEDEKAKFEAEIEALNNIVRARGGKP